MKDWFTHNTDKLMLLSLLLIVLGLAVALILRHSETSAVQWIENIVGQVLAALLTIMVGRTLATRKDDAPNGAASPPDGGTKQ